MTRSFGFGASGASPSQALRRLWELPNYQSEYRYGPFAALHDFLDGLSPLEERVINPVRELTERAQRLQDSWITLTEFSVRPEPSSSGRRSPRA